MVPAARKIITRAPPPQEPHAYRVDRTNGHSIELRRGGKQIGVVAVDDARHAARVFLRLAQQGG